MRVDMRFKHERQVQINILNNTINLDEPCWQCGETRTFVGYGGAPEPDVVIGLVKGYDKGEHCSNCDNNRFTLTSAGYSIVELMERHSPSSAVVVPIASLAPEPYKLIRDIPVLVASCGESFTASFMDANISASGDTQEEAFSNLKGLLLDVFESLADDGNLGSGPHRQKYVLAEFIKRKPNA